MQNLGLEFETSIMGKFRRKPRSRNLSLKICSWLSLGYLPVAMDAATVSAAAAAAVRDAKREMCSSKALLPLQRLTWWTDRAIYTVSQKNIPDIFDCNLKTNYHILIIFGSDIPDTTCQQKTI